MPNETFNPGLDHRLFLHPPFLYTGAAKFSELTHFKDRLVSSPLLGSIAGVTIWALPIAEILLAIVLFVPKWQLKGLYASFALMTAFTLYLAVILLIDSHLSCRGIIENLSPRQHLLFKVAAIMLALIAILCAPRWQVQLRSRLIYTTVTSLPLAFIGWTILAGTLAPPKPRAGLEG